MLDDAKDEIVAIGVRHKNVVNAYADAIRDRFPNRPLFVVTGSTTTLAARRKLRKTLKESGNRNSTLHPAKSPLFCKL